MSAFNPAYNPVGYPTDAYGQPILENSYAPFYPGPFADQYVPHHWTPDPTSAREYPRAGAALPHSTPMATTPISTPEDTPQHPPTPPTFPPPITMRTQSPLQPQSLRKPRITIPHPAHHSPFKPLLLLGSKGSKPTPSNATKSSASSACPLQNSQGVPAPSLPA
ncbi:hypothetical protein C0989_012442 [Termitomyces sp. Mn162]|nr:hypothetical protein C0989_012442 [Termitomyces sp. Mn162]